MPYPTILLFISLLQLFVSTQTLNKPTHAHCAEFIHDLNLWSSAIILLYNLEDIGFCLTTNIFLQGKENRTSDLITTAVIL